MRHYYNKFASYVGSMDSTQWLLLAAVVCFLGFLLLRGFGSRKYY